MTEAPASQTLSERESFENGYYHFVYAIKILSLPADAQCQLMNCPFNAAWELVCDLRGRRYLLESPSSSRLSLAQRQAIEALLGDLDDVPHELFAGQGPARNLEVMSHPFWQPLRERATLLLHELEPATLECRRFLGLEDGPTS